MFFSLQGTHFLFSLCFIAGLAVASNTTYTCTSHCLVLGTWSSISLQKVGADTLTTVERLHLDSTGKYTWSASVTDLSDCEAVAAGTYTYNGNSSCTLVLNPSGGCTDTCFNALCYAAPAYEYTVVYQSTCHAAELTRPGGIIKSYTGSAATLAISYLSCLVTLFALLSLV